MVRFYLFQEKTKANAQTKMTTFDFSAQQQRQQQQEAAHREQSVSEEKEKVNCKYSKYGCEVRLTEGEREAHEAEYMAVHLALVEDWAARDHEEALKGSFAKLCKAATDQAKSANGGQQRSWGVCGRPRTEPLVANMREARRYVPHY